MRVMMLKLELCEKVTDDLMLAATSLAEIRSSGTALYPLLCLHPYCLIFCSVFFPCLSSFAQNIPFSLFVVP